MKITVNHLGSGKIFFFNALRHRVIAIKDNDTVVVQGSDVETGDRIIVELTPEDIQHIRKLKWPKNSGAKLSAENPPKPTTGDKNVRGYN